MGKSRGCDVPILTSYYYISLYDASFLRFLMRVVEV